MVCPVVLTIQPCAASCIQSARVLFAGPQPDWSAITPLPDIRDNFTRTCDGYDGPTITTMAATVEIKSIPQAPKASTNSLYDSMTSTDNITLGYEFPA
jgi:hypothetical protein